LRKARAIRTLPAAPLGGSRSQVSPRDAAACAGRLVKVVENYATWLAETDIPKLFINADPGSILVGRQRERCRAWPNQTEVTVKGRHFVQEDTPDEIGHAVADFVRRVRSQ
jgi:pimeloyl-ACP methyl ester carboxylesterase